MSIEFNDTQLVLLGSARRRGAMIIAWLHRQAQCAPRPKGP